VKPLRRGRVNGESEVIPKLASRLLKLGLALQILRTRRAATHGRGMWDLNLGGQASFGITSLSPFTATAPGAGFTLR